MVSKAKPADRLGIIGRVTTPLAFFTLGILIIEVILGLQSVSVTGIDRTILIVGMLIGFGMLCTMVFVLARQSRYAFTSSSPATAIAQMHLTANDIRTIYVAHHQHGRVHEVKTSAILVDNQLPWRKRIQKLKRLGLVDSSFEPDHSDTGLIFLSEEGNNLALLIARFAQAIIQGQKNGLPDL
jgi:hypothetical protein